MTIEELMENFEFLDDWMQRYSYIIDLGRKLEPLDASYKTEAFRVKGCQSQVWLRCIPDPGSSARCQQLHFVADSDAHIVRGLLAIVLIIFSDKTPQEILSLDPEAVFDQLGLIQHLSPNRTNGLRSVVQRIQSHAQSF